MISAIVILLLVPCPLPAVSGPGSDTAELRQGLGGKEGTNLFLKDEDRRETEQAGRRITKRP